MRRLAIAIVLFVFATSAFAETLTNAGLVKMLDAKLPEAVILDAISTQPTEFDTSADALIKLQSKGASAAVLQAVLNPKNTNSGKHADSTEGLNPEEVLIAQGDSENSMMYTVPSIKTKARALGFGGVASYAVLRGSNATTRLPASGIEFIVSVPENAQPESYVTLASLAIRDNGTREVLVGSGYMGYTSGIHEDRVIAVKIESLEDQSRAREDFLLYRVTPQSTLGSGEYALVLYTSEVQTVGYFVQAANSFFDFGVD